MNKSTDKIFDKAQKSTGKNSFIDFRNSSTNTKKIQDKRTEKLQVYLTKDEMANFYKTMKHYDERTKRVEKQSERLRNIILEDIKKRIETVK